MAATHQPVETPLARLLAGNRSFADGSAQHPRSDSGHRETLVAGQSPATAVLGCSDSRVVPEIVFDQGLGDMFVIRTAGHVLDSASLASLEYAVADLGVRHIVVLGHEGCGAVTAALAAIDGADPLPGNLGPLVNDIRRRVETNDQVKGATDIERRLLAAVDSHVRATVADIGRESAILAAACAGGALAITGARYSLSSGTVTVLD